MTNWTAPDTCSCCQTQTQVKWLFLVCKQNFRPRLQIETPSRPVPKCLGSLIETLGIYHIEINYNGCHDFKLNFA